MSVGEVYRLVGTLKTDINKLDNKLDGKPSTAEYNHLKERIIDLESWQTWAMRLGIPGLLGVVLNLLNTINGGGS